MALLVGALGRPAAVRADEVAAAPASAAPGSAAALHIAGAPQLAGEPEEALHYRWRVRGLLSGIASFFLPTAGEGRLSQHRLPDGHVVSELLITSPKSKAGEYWYYGAELDPASASAIRAWSSYTWRGETKAKKAEIDRRGVIDVASGILILRHDPPKLPRRLEIWSEGRLYPVVVMPLERERRRLRGREVVVRRYSIQGVEVPGQRRWKGRLELWLADDGIGTPVEIVVDRGFASLQLLLAD